MTCYLWGMIICIEIVSVFCFSNTHPRETFSRDTLMEMEEEILKHVSMSSVYSF